MNQTKARSSGTSSISTDDSHYPPFHVWVKAAGLLVLVLGGSFAYSYAYGPYPSPFIFARRLAKMETPHQPSRFKVVAIGTSMMQCALYWDKELEQLASDNGLGQMSFIRFTRSAAVLKNYRCLCRRILQLKPDVVIIEDALFLLRFSSWEATPMVQHRQFLKNAAKCLLYYAYSPLGVLLFQDIENWGNYIEPPVVPRQDQEELLKYRQDIRQCQARPFEDARLLGDFLRQARARGIHIVFLRIPRSPEAESVFPDSIRRASEGVLQQYREVYGVETLRYPQELPMHCYRDFGHMGPEGQKVFSTWFVRELSERFRPDRPDNRDGYPSP